MKLYRIRRKDTGQFFSVWSPYSTVAAWTDAGCFFKKIDTIAQHLIYLCSDWERSINSLGFAADLKRATVKIKKTYPARYKLYEVVVNDVTIRGEEVIQAAALMKKRKPK